MPASVAIDSGQTVGQGLVRSVDGWCFVFFHFFILLHGIAWAIKSEEFQLNVGKTLWLPFAPHSAAELLVKEACASSYVLHVICQAPLDLLIQ